MIFKDIDYSPLTRTTKMSAEKYIQMKNEIKAIKRETFWQIVATLLCVAVLITTLIA